MTELGKVNGLYLMSSPSQVVRGVPLHCLKNAPIFGGIGT
jgi:hypothetical protein